MKNIALILASGTGERSGLSVPKQFYEIDDKTFLEIVVSTFDGHSGIDEIIVVTNKEYLERTQNLLRNFSKVKKIISGGVTRQESSYKGIMALGDEECNVLIHDAARVFVSEKIISACIESLQEHDAVCTVVNSTDTMFEVDSNGKIVNVPQRATLRCAQTPQCFRLSLIKKAHKKALEKGLSVTDDCGLVTDSKLAEIYTVSGDTDNKKITYSEDFELAKIIYKKRLDLKRSS